MKFNTIYILTPPGVVTGGPEALFQLCDAINKMGSRGVLLFRNEHPNPVPNEYAHYQIEYLTFDNQIVEIINKPNNLLIVPEIWTDFLSYDGFDKMVKSVWWLSVDNCYNRDFISFDEDVIHFYQSYYAKSYLESRGISNIIPLYDYLNDDFLFSSTVEEKRNMICYSIKGEYYAKLLSECLPEYEFVILKDMSRVEVRQILSESKIFIDFGHHPGKDRIPRESVMMGSCLLTNRKGSANLFEDVSIHNRYKVEEFELQSVVELIRDIIDNYDLRITDFDYYKKQILSQKEEFFDQVKKIIKMKDNVIFDNQTIERWFSSKTDCDMQLSSYIQTHDLNNRNPNYNEICRTLFGCDDVYQNFEYGERRNQMDYPSHIGSKTINKIVEHLGRMPILGIEVGSFIGSSATILGNLMRISGGVLICVDTWCGDINMWLLESFRETMSKSDGDPKIFQIFMQNMIDNGMSGVVVPLRVTSIVAARMMRVLNYDIDFVYVDSAHEAGETFMELMLYHDVLRPGGVLFGDDYNCFPAVKYDVDKFCDYYGYKIDFTGDGDTWIIKKTE